MEPDLFIGNRIYGYDQSKFDIHFNMHQIDPSLNKIMAMLYFTSYERSKNHRYNKDRIPNTNIEIYLRSVEQNTFGEKIKQNEYFDLIKNFLIKYPTIIDERYMHNQCTIEKGILQPTFFNLNNIYIYIIPTDGLDTREKMEQLINESANDELIKDLVITSQKNHYYITPTPEYAEKSICIPISLKAKRHNLFSITNRKKSLFLYDEGRNNAWNNYLYNEDQGKKALLKLADNMIENFGKLINIIISNGYNTIVRIPNQN